MQHIHGLPAGVQLKHNDMEAVTMTMLVLVVVVVVTMVVVEASTLYSSQNGR